jgi:hypothetical protein
LREVEHELRFIVEIAHIRAAEPGGARYDETMSDDERRHQSNLMLFCDPHHDIVDDKANVRIYTTDMLLRWKAQREADPRQALQRLREVTPAGLRKIVAEGLTQHDARMLSTLERLKQRDGEAASLMRSLVDELTEAYSRQRRNIDPDTVMELGYAVRTPYGMRDLLDEFATAVTNLRRRPPAIYE